MTESAMYAILEKNNDWSYLSVRLYTTVRTTLARHTYRCNSGTGIMGVTNHFIIEFKTHFIDMKLKPGIGAKNPRLRYDIEPKGEPVTIILLSIHSI